MNGFSAKTVLVAVLLVGGLAACGDDGGGDADAAASAAGSSGGEGSEADSLGGNGQGEASDPGEVGSGVGGFDSCSLLETSEVEAQFGEVGSVAEGELVGEACYWDINDQDGDLAAMVNMMADTSHGDSRSARAAFEEDREDLNPDDVVDGGPVDIEGLGDDAFVTSDGTRLSVLSQETTVSITALGYGTYIGDQASLEALARLVLDRL